MGERRLAELFKRTGVEEARALTGVCLDYAETYYTPRHRRYAGRYSTEVLIEHDTISDQPSKIIVEVEVKGDKLKVDFTGTMDQRDNALNCPTASTLLMTNYAVKCVVAPEIAQNEGCFLPVETVVSESCMLNPRWPAAVSVRHLAQQAVADAVLKAMAPLVPDHASAGCQISFPTFCAGGFDERPERRGLNGAAPYYVISDIIGDDLGGRKKRDAAAKERDQTEGFV